MPENHDNQIMVTEKWINAKGQENHVCMCGLYHGWSIYGYNIVNMTIMLILSYIHGFDIKLV